MYADALDIKDKHYWWGRILETDVEKFKDTNNWRWLFSEPVKGKLQLPVGLKKKNMKKKKAAEILEILKEMFDE